MDISLIVAMAKGRVIGKNGGMPWHLPDDLRHFKTLTMGKPVVMGRKTYQSIGKPLPGRTNIVISRTRRSLPAGAGLKEAGQAGVIWASSLDEAIKEAEPCEELMIIGGEMVYSSALPMASRIYVTEIDLDVDGDTFFPPIDAAEWRCEQVDQQRDQATNTGLTFKTYSRI